MPPSLKQTELLNELIRRLCTEYLQDTSLGHTTTKESIPTAHTKAVQIEHRLTIAHGQPRSVTQVPPPPVEYSTQILRQRFENDPRKALMEKVIDVITRSPLVKDKQNVLDFIARWTAHIDHRFPSRSSSTLRNVRQPTPLAYRERPETTTASSANPSRLPSSGPLPVTTGASNQLPPRVESRTGLQAGEKPYYNGDRHDHSAAASAGDVRRGVPPARSGEEPVAAAGSDYEVPRTTGAERPLRPQLPTSNQQQGEKSSRLSDRTMYGQERPLRAVPEVRTASSGKESQNTSSDAPGKPPSSSPQIQVKINNDHTVHVETQSEPVASTDVNVAVPTTVTVDQRANNNVTTDCHMSSPRTEEEHNRRMCREVLGLHPPPPPSQSRHAITPPPPPPVHLRSDQIVKDRGDIKVINNITVHNEPVVPHTTVHVNSRSDPSWHHEMPMQPKHHNTVIAHPSSTDAGSQPSRAYEADDEFMPPSQLGIPRSRFPKRRVSDDFDDGDSSEGSERGQAMPSNESIPSEPQQGANRPVKSGRNRAGLLPTDSGDPPIAMPKQSHHHQHRARDAMGQDESSNEDMAQSQRRRRLLQNENTRERPPKRRPLANAASFSSTSDSDEPLRLPERRVAPPRGLFPKRNTMNEPTYRSDSRFPVDNGERAGHRTPLPLPKRSTMPPAAPPSFASNLGNDSQREAPRFRRASSQVRPVMVHVPTSQSEGLTSDFENPSYKPHPTAAGIPGRRGQHRWPSSSNGDDTFRKGGGGWRSPTKNRVTPIASLTRQQVINSPARSLYSNNSDWKHSVDDSLGGGDVRRMWQKAQAAFSLYPTPGEVVALVRDVIYCLQGIDGQHLRYNADYGRFMLPADLPLTRPLRVLAHRMVAPGNCFMRIHAATNCSMTQTGSNGQTRFAAAAAMTGGVRRGQWVDSTGKVTSHPFEIKEDVRYGNEHLASYIPPATSMPVACHTSGLVVTAFLGCVREMLSAYYHELGQVESELAAMGNVPRDDNVLETFPAPRILFSSRVLRRLIVRLRPVLKRIHCVATAVSLTAGQVGGELLSTLDDLRRSGDPTRAATIQQLFDAAIVPLNEMVRDWIVEGKLEDQYNEWFIKQTGASSFYSSWRESQSIDWSLVPSFLSEDATKSILNTGRMAYFIRRLRGSSHFDQMRNDPALCNMVDGSPLSNNALCDVPGIGWKALEEGGGGGRDITEGSLSRGPLAVDSEGGGVTPAVLTELPYSQRPVTSNGTHKSNEWPCRTFGNLLGQLSTYGEAHGTCIRHILIEEYRLMDHLEALKGFLLLGYGDFIECLIEESNVMLVECGSAASVTQSEIDYCILKAIRSSIAVNQDETLLSHLKAIKATPEEQFGTSKWEFFTLDWSISDNPISVVIRDDLRFHYRRLFSMLWKIRRVSRLHHSVWAAQMNNSFLSSFQEIVGVIADVQALRNEILHCVQCIEHYVFNDVIGPSYDSMIGRLREGTWKDLDELIDMQEEFVQTLLLGCFLDEWPEPTQLKCLAFSNGSGDSGRSELDKSFLSASCILPMITKKTRKRACAALVDSTAEPPHIAQLLDDILELAAAYLDLSDAVHLGGFEVMERILEAENSGAGLMEDERNELSLNYQDEHGPNIEQARYRFTLKILDLMDALEELRNKYQSDAVATLMVRLDYSGFYARLKRHRDAHRALEDNKMGGGDHQGSDIISPPNGAAESSLVDGCNSLLSSQEDDEIFPQREVNAPESNFSSS